MIFKPTRWMAVAAAVAIFLTVLIPAAATAADDLESVLAGVEKRYAGQGFGVDFFQESTLKAMQITDTARGRLTVKRPGRMRWVYESPERQVIVTDGVSLWIWRPDDNQVMVGKAPDFFGDGKGAFFLSDMGQVRQHFVITKVASQNENLYRLKLVPKAGAIDLAAIVISVRKNDFQVAQVVTLNAYGDETRIVLTGYRFNIDLNDALFRFEIPEGADVVQMTP